MLDKNISKKHRWSTFPEIKKNNIFSLNSLVIFEIYTPGVYLLFIPIIYNWRSMGVNFVIILNISCRTITLQDALPQEKVKKTAKRMH